MSEIELEQNRIIRFAEMMPNCALATVRNGRPRVRVMSLWFAHGSGFYFHTENHKDVAKQLRENPQVEACFYSAATVEVARKMLRVDGRVEFLADKDGELRNRLMTERPFLDKVLREPDGSNLALFKITDAMARLWELDPDGAEIVSPPVRFGDV